MKNLIITLLALLLFPLGAAVGQTNQTAQTNQETNSLTTGASPAPTPELPLKLPSIIGDHMVLQQKLADPIWGWDQPGTKVTVSFAGKEYTATAGNDGRWMVKLDPMPANTTPQTMTITGSSKRELTDILIGEVWLCSGQSNMKVSLAYTWNGDVEAASANLPNLRLITVPNVGTQELQNDFKGQWEASTPTTAAKFSAVGFYYGRLLLQILNVPVGLINDSWGGSSAEAWVRRNSLEQDPHFKRLMEATVKKEASLNSAEGKQKYQEALTKWQAAVDQAKTDHKTPPAKPASPESWLAGNGRPGNIFAGVLNPTIGYGIKGVIWYQGESNASFAYEYNYLFSYLIEQWRKEWGQGNFPFYWVQLANYLPQKPQPGDSTWAELREAQTKTMQLTNTGQAVIIDIGEERTIHPKNKHDVADRLARWALANDYGMKMPYRSPEFQMLEISGNKATVTIDCHGSKLLSFDNKPADVQGFALCGEDGVWHWAQGKVVGANQNQVELTSAEVAVPVAVRYAWADNPVCNLYSADGLPVTPFRTDNFPMVTAPKPSLSPASSPWQVAPGTSSQPSTTAQPS
jgi:sialate O-acetylesterase